MAGAFDMDDLDDFDEVGSADTPQPDTSEPEQQSSLVSSAAYFDHAARSNISWFHPQDKAWRIEVDGTWKGWSTTSTDRADAIYDWTPWTQILDDSDAPFYRWYSDAMTNAAFNEVDIHVLEGHGDELAYIEEPDPAVANGKTREITRHELLYKSAAAAHELRSKYGLTRGDRVLFFLPASIEQIVWVEACKRLGVIYCCCNPGLPAEQIADRVHVLQAKVVITAEHPEWSYVVHKALNNYVTVDEAVVLLKQLPDCNCDEQVQRWANRHTVSLQESPFKESSVVVKPKLEVPLGAQVLILSSVSIPLNFVQQRIPKPEVKATTNTIDELPKIKELEESSLRGPKAVARIWAQFGSPIPVEANFPLFVIFTSGTTGKPKGVCHAHAAVAGLVETMKVVFDARPCEDRMLTVGALGWITGQSYQISAPLASRITAVLMQGNPVRPKRSRFADVINKHAVTIFKAGSAFLREVMSNAESMQEVRDANTHKTLRIATFCAEPVSTAVQEFAMDAICKNYINSYWATEHGGIAWSKRYDDSSQVLKANTHSWPLPWVDSDTYCFDEASRPEKPTGCWKARPAEPAELAEVVLTAPYPYMFRYVWGDVQSLLEPGWTGDRTVMTQKYWRKAELPDGTQQWVYIQGDFALKHDGGAYTFHGRSDEVLNVNGILYGTEHIEGAVLRDKQNVKDSVVGQCVVVGYPDKIAGQVPLAFVVPSVVGRTPQQPELLRLYGLVNEVVGPVQVKFVTVSELPQTFSGKFMRRLLKSIACQEPLGDTSTMANPGCLTKISEEFSAWKMRQRA